MAAMTENPYTWGRKSSDITGKVVSLSFKSKGKKLDVSNLDKDNPIDIFIPRDAPVELPNKFTYNCSTHKGWRVHKLVIDNNGSAVNIEVGFVSSNRQFEVFVRRGKPPTVTDFDWRAVSPNKTNIKPFNVNLRKHSYVAERSVNMTNKVYKSSEIPSNLTESLNETKKEEHNVTTAKHDLKIVESNVSLFLSQARLYVGTYYIGSRFLTTMPSAACDHEDFNITYTLRTFTSKCLYWNEEFQKWKTDGCEVCVPYLHFTYVHFCYQKIFFKMHKP